MYAFLDKLIPREVRGAGTLILQKLLEILDV
jgi:hypothetical protein